MAIKLIIVVLFIGVLLSLSSGLFFLLKDITNSQSQRLRLALGIRIVLASLLMGTIYYGLHTGQLKSQAPWDAQRAQTQGH